MNHTIGLSRGLGAMVCGALVALATACALALTAQAADTATMYRLYNPNSGEHFYTASLVERQAVIDAGWDDEGEGWTAPIEGVQVYRLYNSFAGEHHYTTSAEERDMLVSVGWTWEEGGWCSDYSQAVPLYRAYNPNAFANNHHYTTDWGEFQFLLSLGWQDEGIGWYGVDPDAFVPEDPDVPDYPNTPDDPYDPGTPDVPSTPDTPSVPDVPSTPDTPDTPDPSVPSATKYTVTFDGNGGTVEFATKSVEKGDYLRWTPTATRDDYYCVGWYTSPTGGTEYDYYSEVDSDITLYAHWELTEDGKIKQTVANVKMYSYSIKPVNGSFNNMFFVETDNPDPYSFQLVDKSSKYLENDETSTIKPVPWSYGDVVYTNAETKRIANKGYLFYNYECNTDGGSLELKANIGYSYHETDYGYSSSDGTNYDTGVTVTCSTLEDRQDYLIRTYAAGQTGFFDKLNAVQSGLRDIALYPKSVRDTSKPSESAYPCLAASPYYELSLNKHIEGMYEKGDALFISSAYGFVLDSLSYPGMIGSVAERLQPDCEVKGGTYHYNVDITYNGETHTYGGAGEGSTYPIYTKFVEKTFRFDGTDQGYGTNLSMPTLKAKRLEYADKSDEFAETALAKLSREAVSSVVGDGAWIQIAYEGLLGGGTTIGYATYAYDGYVDYASDAWVDGRYVNDRERVEVGTKFADYPNADIILHDVTYTDRNGNTYTTSVTYRYKSDGDYWHAVHYYTKRAWYQDADFDALPDSLKLTREQVNAMVASGQIDGNTSTPPTAKYIYDGTAEPGTPCN